MGAHPALEKMTEHPKTQGALAYHLINDHATTLPQDKGFASLQIHHHLDHTANGYVGHRHPRLVRTMQEAKEAAEDGMDRAYRGATEEWKTYALSFVRLYAQHHHEVFVDGLWGAGLMKPREPRALGPVIRRAVGNGWITSTGRAQPSAGGNGRLQAVWASLICEEE